MEDVAALAVYVTARFSVVGSALDNGGQHQQTTLCGGKNHKARRKSIFLDVNDPYTRRLIQKAFAHPSREPYFSIVLGPGYGMDAVQLPPTCDFQWAEYERIDWEAVQAGRHGASSYCIRKGLSRKAQLAYYTHKHVLKHPNSLLKDSLPQTVVIDTWSVWEDAADGSGGRMEDLADVVVGASQGTRNVNQREKLEVCLKHARAVMVQTDQPFENNPHEETAPVWILKGSTTNKGAGIYLVHVYEQLVDICWSESDIREWVLQRYISPPLLINRRKFHIRAYAVAISALKVYLSQECLALCAGTPYRESNTAGNLFAHVTNTAYQSVDPYFQEEHCILLWAENGTIALLLVKEGICADLAEAKRRVRKVISDMERITAELFRAYQCEYSVFAPIEGCFEHYGLDFIVDQNWKVYLLEVNPGPDFRQTGTRLEKVIEDLMASTIDVGLMDAAVSQSNRSGCLKLVYERQSPG